MNCPSKSQTIFISQTLHQTFPFISFYTQPFHSTAKSPVFSQMSATLTGISTIRACKANERLALEFDNLQNVHSGVWQTLMSINTGWCCKAINDEHGEIAQTKKNVKKTPSHNFFLTFLSLSHFSLYAACAMLDYSFGTLVGLCIVRLCSLRLLQFRRHESG